MYRAIACYDHCLLVLELPHFECSYGVDLSKEKFFIGLLCGAFVDERKIPPKAPFSSQHLSLEAPFLFLSPCQFEKHAIAWLKI